LTVKPTNTNPIQYTDVDKLNESNKDTINTMKDEDLPAGQLAIQRRANRNTIGNAKDTNIVVNSANKYGIDLNNPPTTPITDNYKNQIANDLSAQVSKESTDKFLKYADSHPNPNFLNQPVINPDEEKKNARRERNAKWADALYAFGEGLQGKTANPDTFASNRIKRKRNEEFQNFKNVAEANKQTANNWQYNYRKDLTDWIDKQLSNENLKESERLKYQQLRDQLAQQQKQFEDEMGFKRDELAARERMAQNENASREKMAGTQKPAIVKTPYSDAYYKLSGNSPKALLEYAKYSGAPVDNNGNVKIDNADIERYSESLLGQMFNIDSKGNMTPKPGKENYINDINSKIEQVKSIPDKIKALKDEMETKKKENHWFLSHKTEADITDEYAPKINALQSQLDASQSQLNNMFSGKDTGQGSVEEPAQQQNTNDNQNDPLNLGI
jgi:hypothetical protein